VIAGGQAVGPCYGPTLIGEVPEDSELARLETFGPVAGIEVADSGEDAVRRANATSYGLSSGIITQDADRGLALAQLIDAGMVHINDQPVGDSRRCPSGASRTAALG
jgi:acyl-CoA reductase-like NAD-dependent aldehyde dehydrogenase